MAKIKKLAKAFQDAGFLETIKGIETVDDLSDSIIQYVYKVELKTNVFYFDLECIDSPEHYYPLANEFFDRFQVLEHCSVEEKISGQKLELRFSVFDKTKTFKLKVESDWVSEKFLKSIASLLKVEGKEVLELKTSDQTYFSLYTDSKIVRAYKKLASESSHILVFGSDYKYHSDRKAVKFASNQLFDELLKDFRQRYSNQDDLFNMTDYKSEHKLHVFAKENPDPNAFGAIPEYCYGYLPFSVWGYEELVPDEEAYVLVLDPELEEERLVFTYNAKAFCRFYGELSGGFSNYVLLSKTGEWAVVSKWVGLLIGLGSPVVDEMKTHSVSFKDNLHLAMNESVDLLCSHYLRESGYERIENRLYILEKVIFEIPTKVTISVGHQSIPGPICVGATFEISNSEFSNILSQALNRRQTLFFIEIQQNEWVVEQLSQREEVIESIRKFISTCEQEVSKTLSDEAWIKLFMNAKEYAMAGLLAEQIGDVQLANHNLEEAKRIEKGTFIAQMRGNTDETKLLMSLLEQ